MANQFRSEPVRSIGHVNEYVRDQDHHHSGHQSPYPPNEPPPTEHTEADVASILGLPEALVTPAVMSSVTRILAEVDRLRWLDAQHRRRQSYLEGLADRDPVVAALNRRGFMRELEALLSAGSGDGTLVVLHVVGIEQIRQVQGMIAGDGALRHISANLVGSLRSSDLVGLLGVTDFAVLMAATDLWSAREKVRDVMERINSQPYIWLGQPYSFAMFSGYHVLVPGESAEAALGAADRARRGLPD
ncbi:GGDEF domain-containing protein [Paramagnetospirillum kuznetsovii]|uniref:GGDEF domain-containing protein n=1 Tax=Paramagnetospirillum kuznetsovii TaxID=2053833 RepID=A0A364NVW6_9PROT|nr:GGDEF domain-containing protein [Paramagnetospirillum kuznetsovii]RAU21202.1 GGDEF domain-containing protein [Paramagnetospirillum kuznetsovii]